MQKEIQKIEFHIFFMSVCHFSLFSCIFDVFSSFFVFLPSFSTTEIVLVILQAAGAEEKEEKAKKAAAAEKQAKEEGVHSKYIQNVIKFNRNHMQQCKIGGNDSIFSHVRFPFFPF